MVPPGMEFNCSGNEPAQDQGEITESGGASIFDNL